MTFIYWNEFENVFFFLKNKNALQWWMDTLNVWAGATSQGNWEEKKKEFE